MSPPVINCKRIAGHEVDLLVFDCPHCWQYGGSHGYDDVDCGGFYRRRPKRAKPREHVHGAGERGSPFGFGDGSRAAHCIPGSPFHETGYILREVADE